MKKDLTLLVLAAGMGSRFGGLKQMEPVGPNGEFIIDYSIHDAIYAGFNKVVFVIKEENLELFKETVGKRIEDKIKVEYAFQKQENIPEGYSIPKERGPKPWGTGQALLAAKDFINEPFAIISADDFYGRDAFVKLANFLNSDKISDTNYVTLAYQIKNTLSKNGTVKRGLVSAKGEYVDAIIESVVENNDGKLIAAPLNGNDSFEIPFDMPVSMIMFGLNPNVFEILQLKWEKFFEDNKKDLTKCELIMPMVLEEFIQEGVLSISIEKTNAQWFGITYIEDLKEVKENIENLIEENIYPEKLWD